MSNSREALSALLATRGKGGSIEAISQSAGIYASDSQIHPEDFTMVVGSDVAKALVALGGYISLNFGIAPKDVFAMRVTLARKYEDICGILDLPKEDFIPALSELESEVISATVNKAVLEHELGIDNARYVDGAVKSINKIMTGSTLSPVTRHNLAELVKAINGILEYETTNVGGTLIKA